MYRIKPMNDRNSMRSVEKTKELNLKNAKKG